MKKRGNGEKGQLTISIQTQGSAFFPTQVFMREKSSENNTTMKTVYRWVCESDCKSLVLNS